MQGKNSTDNRNQFCFRYPFILQINLKQQQQRKTQLVLTNLPHHHLVILIIWVIIPCIRLSLSRHGQVRHQQSQQLQVSIAIHIIQITCTGSNVNAAGIVTPLIIRKEKTIPRDDTRLSVTLYKPDQEGKKKKKTTKYANRHTSCHKSVKISSFW